MCFQLVFKRVFSPDSRSGRRESLITESLLCSVVSIGVEVLELEVHSRSKFTDRPDDRRWILMT